MVEDGPGWSGRENLWTLERSGRYDSLEGLTADLDERVIRPTEAMVLELRPAEAPPSQKLP